MEEGSWVRPALPLSLFLTLSVCTTQRLSSRKSDPQHGGWTSSTLTPKEFLRNGSLTSNWEISSSRTLQRQVPGKRTFKKKKSPTQSDQPESLVFKKEKRKKKTKKIKSHCFSLAKAFASIPLSRGKPQETLLLLMGGSGAGGGRGVGRGDSRLVGRRRF